MNYLFRAGARNFSGVTIAIFGVLYLASFLFFGRYKGNTFIGGDPLGYYSYLPATFIYHDLPTLDSTVAQVRNYRPELFQQGDVIAGIKLENGNFVIKYSMGLALLNIPFFIIGYIFSV